LGKSFLLLWNASFTPCKIVRVTPQAHGSDLAPVKYPTGVTDSSRKYFSWHALLTLPKFHRLQCMSSLIHLSLYELSRPLNCTVATEHRNEIVNFFRVLHAVFRCDSVNDCSIMQLNLRIQAYLIKSGFEHLWKIVPKLIWPSSKTVCPNSVKKIEAALANSMQLRGLYPFIMMLIKNVDFGAKFS
jgi:hypothetical protein